MSERGDVRDGSRGPAPAGFPDPPQDIVPERGDARSEQTAVLAGGCFWCVEAVFKELDGVLDVRSGYAGDGADTADYESVCSGTTDHAEVVLVRFDPERTSYGQILKVFFSVAHDPTQLNRQGNDVGRQYRSAVFYADDAQKAVAQAYIRHLNESGAFSAPVVTRLEPLAEFYEAEAYHQDFCERNPFQPYVRHAALPKLEKLRKQFADRLKSR